MASKPGEILTCLKCSESWPQRGEGPPLRCPRCSSKYWNGKKRKEETK